MARLPVITGFGGVNPAGRSSFHHGYRRMVLDALGTAHTDKTLASLAALMNIDSRDTARREAVLAGTLIRKIESGLLDTEAIEYNQALSIQVPDGAPLMFDMAARQLPKPLPQGWDVVELDNRSVRVTLSGQQNMLVPALRESKVRAAGQLPTGFEPGTLYQSRNHPRGLQMTVYGASDALGSLGIPWDVIAAKVPLDQVSVYAGSGMSQLDGQSNGGMMAARFNGKRVTSKQCPFGFAEMPADFINAYVLGSLGTTGTSMGACASFLYNLRQGINDIRSGASRVVVVGNSEAPIVPEIIEGYAAMGALATDKELMALDNSDAVDYGRACRPFGKNCGFTLSESAQFIVLFDDELAIELGAQIHGAVTDVFVNADGHKKSISAPGVGNYLTMSKALASARSLLGEKAIRQRSFVQAHGTGTPQNRVTESHILNSVAEVFGIEHWPVVAVKNYLGHSIGAAAGDQIVASMGIFADGILPGITSIDGPAEDVRKEHLAISNRHTTRDPSSLDVAIVNAKGFGGNNASATLLAPHIVERMLHKKHGVKQWRAFSDKREHVAEQAAAYDDAMTSRQASPIYKFDHHVLDGEQLEISKQFIRVPGCDQGVSLAMESPYSSWLDHID